MVKYIVVLLVFAFGTAVQAVDYYVATNGSDGAVGTSLGTAFATIQQGIDSMSSGDTLYVRGGRYHEEVLISNVVGSVGSQYTIKNYSDEQPVLDGTIPITGTWTTTNLNGHSVWVTSVDQEIWQLFVDDRMQVVARWPNVTVGHPCDPIQLKDDGYTPEDNTWWDVDTWGDMASSWNAGGNLTNNAAKHDLAAEGVSFAGGSIVLNFHSESQFSRNILTHSAGSNVLVHEEVASPHDKGSGPFLIEHLNALDIPGEWYYDQSTGLVWFWPLDGLDPNTLNIRGKTISYGITMRDSQHWNIENIDFFGCTIDAQESEYITVDDCLFSYPTWFRRMLGEHTYWFKLVDGEPQAKPEPMGEGGTFLMGDKNGSYYTVRHCIFQYSDGRVDMNDGYGNLVENNLFHHWSFSGMASFVLNMNSSPESVQTRNTFHTNGSKVMSKHSWTDVNYSRAYYFGYFQQDGAAWQCAGGNGWSGPANGLRRHHNWHHQAMKTGARWDGHDGHGGTNDHMVSWQVPSSLMVKGDYHTTHNNTGVFMHDPIDNAIRLLDDDERTPPSVRNANSHSYNNLADSISASRSGYTPLNGAETNNWNGYDHPDPNDTAANQLRDPANLDFRPKATSDLIDQGTWVPGINDDYVGSAPDIGAYEFGETNYWIPGFQSLDASTPVPPDGSTTVKIDADLMWLEGRDATSHNVYFGTTSGSLPFVTNQLNNIFSPGPLVVEQTYFWRIDEVTPTGTVVGTEWSFTPGSLKATTFKTLYAIADASVRTNNPTTNYGSSSTLELANYPAGVSNRFDRRAFVKFDVNVTGKVVSAELRLHRSNASSNVDVEIYSMSVASWDESTVTWNTQPARDGVFLDANQVSGGSNWASFVVTEGVTNGVVSLALTKELGSSKRQVDSRESDWPPELVVEYEVPFPNPPAAPQNLSAIGGVEQVSVHWDDNTEEFLAGYHVYRTEYLDDDFIRINATTLTNSSYVDVTAVPGVTNYYKVRAVDDYDQLSAGTPYAEATPLPGTNSPPAVGQLLAYEGFSYPVSSLVHGLNGGTGFSAPWVSSQDGLSDAYFEVVSPGDRWGDLSVSSNRLERTNTSQKESLSRMLSADLAATNLWFSVIWRPRSNEGFAIGSGALQEKTGVPDDIVGGVGFGFTNGDDFNAKACIWNDSGLNESIGSLSISQDTPILLAGYIEFNVGTSGEDRLSLYAVSTNLTLGTPVTVELDVDESALNTLTMETNRGPGYDEIRLGRSLTDVIPTSAPPPEPSPFETWAGEYGLTGAETNYLAHSDTDGMNQLVEYGLGGNPTNDDAAAVLPISGIVDAGGANWLEYVYRRRTDAPARGLAYWLELNTNLVSGTWMTNGYTETGSADLGNGFETVTNQISATETNTFIRLRISID